MPHCYCLNLFHYKNISMSRFMRIMVFFDLPVVDPDDRRGATRFRQFLLKQGYMMVQYSVYCKICNGQDAVRKQEQILKRHMPARGSVRVLSITDKQYADMQLMVGDYTVNERALGVKSVNKF